MKSNGVKSLWGQEFQVAKQGLAEEQVVAFVTDLVNQRDSLLERQQHLNSLQILAERTVTESSQLAEKIKQEAQDQARQLIQEAEDKARETTAEVQEQAERTVTGANELAEKIRQEAHDQTTRLIQEAEDKARETTAEVQEQAERTVTEANELAEKIRQEAQDQTRQLIQEAEDKARETTTEVQEQAERTVTEANELAEKIRQEAQDQTTRLIQEAEDKARETTAEVQEQAERTVTEANELAEKIRQEVQDQTAQLIQEAEDKAGELVSKAKREAETANQEKAAAILEQARQEAAAIIETARTHVSSEIEHFRDRFLSRLQDLITGVGASRKEIEQAKLGAVEEDEPNTLPFSIPISEISSNGDRESLEVKEDLESEFVATVANKSQTVEEATTANPADESVTPPAAPDDATPFEGEVKIAVPPPVDMAQLIRLRRNLQDVSHLKIRRTDGSWNEGSVITMLINKPLPLISLLKEMPEVENAELWTGEKEWADGDFPWGLAFESKPENWQGKKIVVILKKEPGEEEIG